MHREQINSIGMKLHTPVGEDGIRVTEFWTNEQWGYQIGVIDDGESEDAKIETVILTRREAQALRHWLDAALNDG